MKLRVANRESYRGVLFPALQYLANLQERIESKGVKVGSYPRWEKKKNTIALVGRDLAYLESLVPELEKAIQGVRKGRTTVTPWKGKTTVTLWKARTTVTLWKGRATVTQRKSRRNNITRREPHARSKGMPVHIWPGAIPMSCPSSSPTHYPPQPLYHSVLPRRAFLPLSHLLFILFCIFLHVFN